MKRDNGRGWVTSRPRGRRSILSGLAGALILVLVPAIPGQERVRRFGAETSGPPVDRFAIEIGGKIRGYFTHCSGLGSDSDVTEFREGGSNTVQKLPGVVRYAETLCRRRVVHDTYFPDWRLQVEQEIGNFRRNTFVILYDEKNTEVARWELFDAWLSRSFVSETKETKGYAEEVFGLTSRVTLRR